MANTFTKVAEFQYSSEAIIFKGKLESEGLEVFMRDNHTIDADPMVSNAIGGVKLFVKTQDAPQAAGILADISPFDHDEHGKLMKCPNRGNEQADLFTGITDLRSFFAFLLSIFFLVLPFYNSYKYKCRVCGTRFNG